MNPSVRLAVLSAAIAGMLSLSACGKHDDTAASTAPATPATTAVPAPVAPSVPASAPGSALPAPASTAPAPASAGTTAAATAGDVLFRVDSVKLGDAVASNKVTRPRTTFAPSDSSIYASVVTSGRTEGSTLSAHWSYLEGKGQPVTTISQTIATQGPATTTFHIRNPNDWPQGKYKVEIAIDGKPVGSETFEIKA
jgi:glucose/arabinose dehydrogenase